MCDTVVVKLFCHEMGQIFLILTVIIKNIFKGFRLLILINGTIVSD